MERYNLNQLSLCTGLTTRTLRNYINLGLLKGEKIEGVWSFTDEEIESFFTHPDVKRAIAAKRNALVYDFMADQHRAGNRICMILDLDVNPLEAAEISAFFCRTITEIGEDVQFNCANRRNGIRVMLSGAEAMVNEILRRYYER